MFLMVGLFWENELSLIFSVIEVLEIKIRPMALLFEGIKECLAGIIY